MEQNRANDGRKNDKATKEYIRIQVVKLMKEGYSGKVVSDIFGISVRHVYRIMSAFLSGGQKALASKEIPGRPRKLNGDQIEYIASIIRDKTPLQFRFQFALWTVRTVREIIARELNTELSESAVRKLLKGMGFTPQKPRFMAWQQDDVLVQKWHDETFLKIQMEAKACGAAIYFADEAGIRSTDRMGRTWALAGKTPILSATGSRFGVNIISAVGSRGQFEFMVHDGIINAEVFLGFLKRLMEGKEHPVFLIVDNCSIHHAKIIKEYEKEMNGNLRLFYLPPYSPQLNPDEQVWAHMKRDVSGKLPENKLQLIFMVSEALERLKSLPNLIMSFFRHPECATLVL